jgi:Flp pilus assembly protein TadB
MSEQMDAFLRKSFPDLKDELKTAQMDTNVSNFFFKCLLLSTIFGFIMSGVTYPILLVLHIDYLIPIVFVFLVIMVFTLCLRIPKMNQARIRQEIESNIFTLGGMFLTLLESGNSILSALEGVSEGKTKAGRYFGNIASEVYLGKNIDQAIDDAIKYTPSESFRRILQPIKISIKTGTDVQRPLTDTMRELSHERIVDIENYQKKLSPFSMLYMIFGTILPALGVVVVVIFMSIWGIKLDFFPFMFLLLLAIGIVQFVFIKIVQSLRPMVRL